jgi:hypothetical protein
MNEICNLLEQVAVINKKYQKILDDSGSRFNIFQICGVGHDENKHSKIIAEFLNPQGSHGLKSELLRQFVGELGEKFTIKNFDIENARAVTECSIDNGRLDILIEDKNKHALIIENKIYAHDQPEQLERYNEFACNQYGQGNYQIFYLTPYGNNASEQSAGDVDYLPISYKETIIGWLKECVPIAEHHPMVRETLNQYINHLNQLINTNIMDNNPKLRAFVANNIDKIKEMVEIYKMHQSRPGRIRWFLNDKLKEIEISGDHYIDKEEGVPVSIFKLCENNTSDGFEIDFYEDDILWYYNTVNQELKEKLEENKCLKGNLSYECPDEDIAGKIAKQIRTIIDVINEK